MLTAVVTYTKVADRDAPGSGWRVWLVIGGGVYAYVDKPDNSYSMPVRVWAHGVARVYGAKLVAFGKSNPAMFQYKP